MGLAGLGDLVLTCTDDQSRNRRFGLLLAAGKTRGSRRSRRSARWSKVLAATRGARGGAARARRHADREGIWRVLYDGLPARTWCKDLMTAAHPARDRIAG